MPMSTLDELLRTFLASDAEPWLKPLCLELAPASCRSVVEEALRHPDRALRVGAALECVARDHGVRALYLGPSYRGRSCGATRFESVDRAVGGCAAHVDRDSAPSRNGRRRSARDRARARARALAHLQTEE